MTIIKLLYNYNDDCYLNHCTHLHSMSCICKTQIVKHVFRSEIVFRRINDGFKQSEEKQALEQKHDAPRKEKHPVYS